MYINRILHILIICAVVASCRSVKTPAGTVPRRGSLDKDAFGAWMILTKGGKQIAGEFIASSNDSIYILPDNGLQAHAIAGLDTIRIVMYKTDAGAYAVWTSIASVATVLNGLFAVITLPATLVTGITTSVVEGNRINYLDKGKADWSEMRKYARFPQGLPPGLDRKSLRSRKQSEIVKP